MNDYEILLMLDPELPEERQGEILTRAQELVGKQGGVWESHDAWGRRRLAYEIVDKPNFFDVKVFGGQAEMLSQHLAKGRRIGVDGRLDWSSWESEGQKRSKVEIVAQTVQFLDSRADGESRPQFVPEGAGAAAAAADAGFG